jgi:hypothetical protein
MRFVQGVLGTAAAGLVVAGLVVAGVLVAVPATADGRDRAVGECTNAELTASYHARDSAMSHRYGRIVLTNTSDHACRTGGYGGLSYVGGGDGTQIGAPADRTRSRVREIVVRPGRRVVSPVVAVVAGAYPPHRCRPAKVDGFRVYLPDETRSQFIEHRTTGCRNDAVHLLSHKAFRRP